MGVQDRTPYNNKKHFIEFQSFKIMHLVICTNVARLNGNILTFKGPLGTERPILA
jgi:hypothetical protein